MNANITNAIGWICFMVVCCSLIWGIVFYNIEAEKIMNQNISECARAGLVQQVENNCGNTRIIWVKP